MATRSGSKNPGALTDAVAPAESSAAPEPSPGEPVEAQRKPWPVRLYLGEIGYDFIGNRRLWYTISAALILICLGSMIFKQFNLGVEFAGGERFRAPGTEQQLAEVTQAVEDAGADVTSAQVVGDEQLVIITADLSEEQGREVTSAIADAIGLDASDVANSTTSASWGQDVTSKAVQGLLVFLVLVLVFLAVRFQWKMAVGAMVALVHDLVITAGVYSLVGFEVTPASVIGLLTILGFSLYDTVVVFDKVDENAKGLLASQRRTYSESANLAINQVLMRSINTSIFALLPVLGLLYAGVFLIGEGTLQDLALVLFVGMLAGVYSSIFLAVPVLCDLKEREPEYQKLAKRLKAKRAAAGVGSGGLRTTSTGDMALSPAAGARADRSRRRRPADPVPVEDDSDDGTDAAIAAIHRATSGSATDEPDDTGPGGGGTVVASARRTRPRSNRTVSSGTKTSSAKTSSVDDSPAKTDIATQASTSSKGSAATNSAQQSSRRAGPAKRGR
ncbi:MAG: protein translocase subunit SecF [Actinomycetota bacterium]|nr:protein translocase subunit SecF [Actinomycetota bacterium]